MKMRFLAALAALSLAAPAIAAPAVDTITPKPATRVVRYADLNLNDAGDAQVMLRRIHKAAKAACGGGATGYDAIVRFDACYADSVARAVAALDAPAVRIAHARAVRQDVAWLP